MLDETQLREQLRDELAAPAPAVRTDLGAVQRRGQRLRRARQAGAAAAAVAVVVGVATAATLLTGQQPVNAPAGPSSRVPRTTAQPSTVGWPRADMPERRPYGTYSPAPTAPLPSGRPRVTVPLCDLRSDGSTGPTSVPKTFRDALVPALGKVLPSAKVGQLRPGSYREYTVDITDAGGTGMLRVTAYQTPWSPVEAADRQAFDEGNCAPPKREVRPDGTVLQLYPMMASEPYQTLTMTLSIYLPTGEQYDVVAYNIGSKDMPGGKRVGKGRDTLPVTEAQLAQLGEAVTHS
jgi:hypothetical protein